MLKNVITKLKARLFVILGILMFLLCVLLVYFYTRTQARAVSGAETPDVPCACVPYLDSFLYIDVDGKVLSVEKGIGAGLPVVEGIKFDRFSVGGYLQAENKDAFSVLARLTGILSKYGYNSGFINGIDVSNTDDIRLYTNNVYVVFGSAQDADTKMRTIKEVIAQPDIAGLKGVLDVSVVGGKYIFTVLA